MADFIDIVGLRFGKLVVIEPSTERHKSGSKMYICKCDCGNITLSRSDYLRFGKKTSCGCTLNRVGVLDDLSGKRFGFITVISRAPNDSRATKGSNPQAKWNCVCDCGATMVVYGSRLRSGAKTSCGCKTVTDGIGGAEHRRRKIYEQAYGSIPNGHAVITLDNNACNYDLSNLYAIDRDALRIYRNKRLGCICDPELKMLAIKAAELELEIKRAEKRL